MDTKTLTDLLNSTNTDRLQASTSLPKIYGNRITQKEEATTQSSREKWQPICPVSKIKEQLGLSAQVDKSTQVTIFKISRSFYAIENIDPCSGIPILNRGTIGDIKGKPHIASLTHKQHFCLETGTCLEDPKISIRTFPVRLNAGILEISLF